ncbi:MAG: DNA-binding transcriptional LysR family regulator [Candidatus Azotimanducaceae bacterium]|jgi:DNA-binding transcriptional LysR family regulator
MIENLETLLALSRTGTMLEASTELRVSQSAVSKRIATLEKYYDKKLIQKKGRRVELTRHGHQLVDKISPILSELRDLFVEDGGSGSGELVIGVSEAILSSWGPKVFFDIQQGMPDVNFLFHTHRTPVVLDRIRSGEFMAGVCTGSDSLDKDLQSEVLGYEPMVIIPSGLASLQWPENQPLSVITIEDHSGAWRSFKGEAARLNIRREVSLESFFGVAQMAIAGFGHGLVPIGVARTLNVPEQVMVNLGDKGLRRPVRFVARKSTYALPMVSSFFQALMNRLGTGTVG